MPISKAKMRERKRLERAVVNPKAILSEGITQYPAILYALTDPVKRRKLEKVYQSLKGFKQEKNAFYGCSRMVPFDVVGDLLDATEK